MIHFLLHLSLLVGQLRSATTGSVPLFSLAPEELMTEVDDVLLGDLVANMDQLIGNTIEEEEDLTDRADRAIANDFFNSKQHLIKALPILDQLKDVSVDESGNQAYATRKGCFGCLELCLYGTIELELATPWI